METVLKDLYRKKSHQSENTDFFLGLLDNKLDRRLSHYKKWGNSSDARIAGPRRGGKRRAPPLGDTKGRERSDSFSIEQIQEQIQDFKTKVSVVPGFEDLEDKTSPAEIVCWSLILFVLIALTGYSFVHLIMDYLGQIHFCSPTNTVPATTNLSSNGISCFARVRRAKKSAAC